MDVHLLHVVTRRSEVLARIEVTGILGKVLADSSSHREARVTVDIDLADGALGGLAELRLRNADSVRKLAAELVDCINLILRNAGRSVKNDREAGELLFDSLEDVESKRRRNELAGLLVNRALLARELVSAVAGADGDGERIAASLGGELDNFLRLRVVRLGRGDLVLNTGENAELGLDSDVMLVSVCDNLLGELDIVRERKVRTIDHDARETAVNAALAGLKAVTMVKMENDLGLLAAELLGVLYSALSHVAENRGVGVLARTLGNLHDDGGLSLNRSLDDSLHLLHCVEVESRNRITALDGLGEHLLRIYETELFVADHFVFLLELFSPLFRGICEIIAYFMMFYNLKPHKLPFFKLFYLFLHLFINLYRRNTCAIIPNKVRFGYYPSSQNISS